MIVRSISEIKNTERDVKCPRGGFNSLRILLEKDGMGFSMSKTTIPANISELWHYKNHLEACYCISGSGTLINNETGEWFNIEKDVMYALNKNESHTFKSITDVILLCVFNPPIKGGEVHMKDGSYSTTGENDV